MSLYSLPAIVSSPFWLAGNMRSASLRAFSSAFSFRSRRCDFGDSLTPLLPPYLSLYPLLPRSCFADIPLPPPFSCHLPGGKYLDIDAMADKYTDLNNVGNLNIERLYEEFWSMSNRVQHESQDFRFRGRRDRKIPQNNRAVQLLTSKRCRRIYCRTLRDQFTARLVPRKMQILGSLSQRRCSANLCDGQMPKKAATGADHLDGFLMTIRKNRSFTVRT